MEKVFHKLSEFSENNVSLYRSTDLNNTAIYWTSIKDGDKKKASAFFELLWFEYTPGKQQIYIRFPNTDYFVEMCGGGIGSSRGNMMITYGIDVWGMKHKQNFKIFLQEPNLLLQFGDSYNFNFMNLVAKNNIKNYLTMDKGVCNESEIKHNLLKDYLKLPTDIRTVNFLLKNYDFSPTYFIIDSSKYNNSLENTKFRIVKGNDIIECKIINYESYRDGGTTKIKVIDNLGKEHDFFSPTRLGWDETNDILNRPVDKWDDMPLLQVKDEEFEKVIKFLNIELEQK